MKLPLINATNKIIQAQRAGLADLNLKYTLSNLNLVEAFQRNSILIKSYTLQDGVIRAQLTRYPKLKGIRYISLFLPNDSQFADLNRTFVLASFNNIMLLREAIVSNLSYKPLFSIHF